MKIDFSRVLQKLDGQPLKEQQLDAAGRPTDPAKWPDLTLGAVATAALLNGRQSEQLSGQEQSKRLALAHKIFGANGLPLDLAIDDIKLIQDLISANYPSPLIGGAAYDMLNGTGDEN